MGHSVESYILPTIGPVFNRLKSLRVFWFDVLGDEIERTPSFMAGQRFEDINIGELVEGSYCQDGMPFENFSSGLALLTVVWPCNGFKLLVPSLTGGKQWGFLTS